MDGYNARDWPEDVDNENGNYSNICYVCRHEFTGMKGRIVCKICANNHLETTPLEDDPQEA